MLALILFTCLVNNVLSCDVCYSAGYEYSCRETVIWGGCSYKCCDGTWLTCPRCQVQNCPANCPGVFDNEVNVYDRSFIENNYIIHDYDYTYDGRLKTKFVSLVHELKDGLYQVIVDVPSTKLQLGDKIVWKGYEVNAETQNKIVTIEHYNVNNNHTNCCASVSVGFPPHCQIKVCCGDGCCC